MKESEAIRLIEQYGRDRFEVVYPDFTILAQFPVVMVNSNNDSVEISSASREFVNYMYSIDGQKVMSHNHFRSGNGDVIAVENSPALPDIKSTTIAEAFGKSEVTKWDYFSLGGEYSKIQNGLNHRDF